MTSRCFSQGVYICMFLWDPFQCLCQGCKEPRTSWLDIVWWDLPMSKIKALDSPEVGKVFLHPNLPPEHWASPGSGWLAKAICRSSSQSPSQGQVKVSFRIRNFLLYSNSPASTKDRATPGLGHVVQFTFTTPTENTVCPHFVSKSSLFLVSFFNVLVSIQNNRSHDTQTQGHVHTVLILMSPFSSCCLSF